MATTTEIANIANVLDLTDFAGDFVDEFDMDKIVSDYVDAINAALPAGVRVDGGGHVYAELAVADDARAIDWNELTSSIDVAEIFERHDTTRDAL